MTRAWTVARAVKKRSKGCRGKLAVCKTLASSRRCTRRGQKAQIANNRSPLATIAMVRASLKQMRPEARALLQSTRRIGSKPARENKVNRARLIAPFASATRSQPKKRSAPKSRPALHPHCLHANAAVAAPTPLPALHSFRHDPGHNEQTSLQMQPHTKQKETRPRRFETPISTRRQDKWPSPTSPSTAPRRRGASAS